jgi:hypothetical protein
MPHCEVMVQKHTAYDENDLLLLLPLYQWQFTDAKLLSGCKFGKTLKQKKNTSSAV